MRVGLRTEMGECLWGEKNSGGWWKGENRFMVFHRQVFGNGGIIPESREISVKLSTFSTGKCGKTED